MGDEDRACGDDPRRDDMETWDVECGKYLQYFYRCADVKVIDRTNSEKADGRVRGVNINGMFCLLGPAGVTVKLC